MRAADLVRLAGGALARYPARTLAMLAATAIGVAAVLVLTSLGEAARRFVTGEFQALGTHLVIVVPGRSDTAGAGPGMMLAETPRDLTLGDAGALLRSRWVERMAPVVVGSASVSTGRLEREVSVLGTTPEFLAIRRWQMARGEFLPRAGIDRAPPVCTVGATIARELFGDGPAVGEWLRVGDRRCRVTGVLAAQGTSVMIDVDEVVVTPVLFAQALFDSPGLFRIIVQATGRAGIEPARRDILSIIADRHYGEQDVTVITQDAVLATFDGILGALTRALAGIASISLVVAGVLIMNVMLVAVSQRTAEIGLLKALGATRRQITGLFLAEAVFLAGLGALLGAGIGAGMIWLMGAFYPELRFVPPAWAVGGAVLVALLSGLVFGILPARRAARLDAIAALAGR